MKLKTKNLTFSTNSYRTLIYFVWRLKRDEFLYAMSAYSQGDNILLTHTSVKLNKLVNRLQLETMFNVILLFYGKISHFLSKILGSPNL